MQAMLSFLLRSKRNSLSDMIRNFHQTLSFEHHKAIKSKALKNSIKLIVKKKDPMLLARQEEGNLDYIGDHLLFSILQIMSSPCRMTSILCNKPRLLLKHPRSALCL